MSCAGPTQNLGIGGWLMRIAVCLMMWTLANARHAGESGRQSDLAAGIPSTLTAYSSINSLTPAHEVVNTTSVDASDPQPNGQRQETRLTQIDITESDTLVIAQSGHSAFLKCSVRNLGDQMVSWARGRDWHILTSGRHVYTADERFQVQQRSPTNQTYAGPSNRSTQSYSSTSEWFLQIQFVQSRDSGFYICQVSTEKGLVSHQVQLDVLIPEVFILGQKDLIIDQGTTLSLVCIVENSPIPPEFVFWYHNDLLLNFNPNRPGVLVETEHDSRTHSQLKIANAQETDTGNYTCRASNGQPASIYVQVWAGDQAAAMSRKNHAGGILVTASGYTWIYLFTLLFHACHIISECR